MPFPSQKNFLSLHGRLFGFFRGLGFAGDAWGGGDGFQGILRGVVNAQAITAAQNSQATGYAVISSLTQFTTVPAGSFAVLPSCIAGMEIAIDNDGANPLQVCGSAATGDTIDGIATATGVTVTNARRSVFKGLVTAQPASGTTPAVVGLWTSAGMAKST